MTAPAAPMQADALEAAARAMCERVNGIGDYDENIGQRRTGWVAQAKAGIAAYLATPKPAAPVQAEVEREEVARRLLRTEVGDGEAGVSVSWGGNPSIPAHAALAAICKALASLPTTEAGEQP